MSEINEPVRQITFRGEVRPVREHFQAADWDWTVRTLLDPVGAGGMGVVYRALDRRPGTVVGFKLLHEHVAADPSAVARVVGVSTQVAYIPGQPSRAPGINFAISVSDARRLASQWLPLR